MIDQKTSKIFRAIFWTKILNPKILKFFQFFSFAIGILSLSAFLILHFFPNLKLPFLGAQFKNKILGISLISLSFFGIFFSLKSFANQVLKKAGQDLPPEGELDPSENFLDFLNFESALLLKETLKEKYLPLPTCLLYNLLKNTRLNFTLNRLLIPRDELRKALLLKLKEQKKLRFPEERTVIFEENLKVAEEIIDEASKLAQKHGQKRVTILHLFVVLADKEPFFKEFLDKLKILKEDVEEAAMWQQRIEDEVERRKRFWERENLYFKLIYSLTKDFIGGYTITLDQFSHDLVVANPLLHSKIILHQKELQDLEEILAKESENCALIVGEPGSGRKSLIFNLCTKIVKQASLPSLNYMRVLELDMPSLIGASGDLRGLEVNLKTIFNEAVKAENVILVINQIHNYVGEEFGAEAVAKVDISPILLQYLPHPNFRLIGITTYEGFHRAISKSRELLTHFSKIEIKPPTPEETLKILEENVLAQERLTKVFAPLFTLKEIVKLCDFFLTEQAFPLKAINLLDECFGFEKVRSIRARGILLPEEVDTFFSQKYEVPAGVAEEKERETLLNLEQIIHQRLINQEEAVSELANALRRARAEIKKRKRTIGNFLFLGPTGVGKTETAKQLARAYFGSEKNMIRLNMAEYQLQESIDKLIGTLTTPGYLTTQVRENPFSLILIDEIEKAHPNILNLFLSVLDEGTMTDGAGREVDFRHTIIIATSNAGAEYIREAIERGSSITTIKDVLIDSLLRQGIFKPEFINRFDAVVIYRPLKKEEMKEVVKLLLKEIEEGLELKKIYFKITPELVDRLVEIGFDPVFGGRAIRRAVQNYVENIIARFLLAQELKEGDEFIIDPQSWQIKITKRKI
jgi:ATP-dependent Clp protease ATP-binding subunit ClpC